MSAYITATGLFVPEFVITNEELVESYNCYVQNFNLRNAGDIENGHLEALKESSVEFIEKASGIKNRHVVNKEGILNPERMKPAIPRRENSEMSLQCEMAFNAANDALQKAEFSGAQLDMIIVACSNWHNY